MHANNFQHSVLFVSGCCYLACLLVDSILVGNDFFSFLFSLFFYLLTLVFSFFGLVWFGFFILIASFQYNVCIHNDFRWETGEKESMCCVRVCLRLLWNWNSPFWILHCCHFPSTHSDWQFLFFRFTILSNDRYVNILN